eukprot:1249722-Rhodomonas_salina.1
MQGRIEGPVRSGSANSERISCPLFPSRPWPVHDSAKNSVARRIGSFGGYRSMRLSLLSFGARNEERREEEKRVRKLRKKKGGGKEPPC